ncbi:MAG: cbb3-type cytochrome c oxidase subunit I [Microthrixaceae bacterium]
MAVTETKPPEAPEQGTQTATSPAERQPGELETLIGTGDHTSIGRLYIGFSLLLLLAGLIARILTGLDSATDGGILGESYQLLVDSSSLVALVFLGVIPLLLGVATLIVPLQVGSPTIAFPRAAALAMWSWLVFGAIFITSTALDGGIGGNDLDAATLGNVSLGAMMVALALGSVCVATTVVSHRPEGMGLNRTPLFAWSMLVASAIWIVSLGSALAWSIIGHLEADSTGALVDNFSVGLGWLLRGPAVYMLAIPVLGIAGDAVATATGRPLKNFGAFQAMIGGFGIFSFGAWAQNPGSVNTILWALWALAIFLPLLGLLGGLAESMRHGKVRLTAALVGSLLGLLNLLGAATVGLLMALNTAGEGNLFDFSSAQLSKAQVIFVVTAAVAGALAGIAHWSPQIWGAPAADTGASISIGMVDVGGGLVATVLAIEVFVQAGGDNTGDAIFGGFEAAGALLALAGIAGALASYLGATRDPEADDDSDVDSDEAPSGMTLEWQVDFPASAGGRTVAVGAVESPYPLYESTEDA